MYCSCNTSLQSDFGSGPEHCMYIRDAMAQLYNTAANCKTFGDFAKNCNAWLLKCIAKVSTVVDIFDQ